MTLDKEPEAQSIQCLGCESGCEVLVAFRDGRPVCLGGNNCPTGAQFACAQLLAQQAPGTSGQPPLKNI